MEELTKWLSQVEPAWAFAIIILLGLGYGAWKLLARFLEAHDVALAGVASVEKAVDELIHKQEKLVDAIDRCTEQIEELEEEIRDSQ